MQINTDTPGLVKEWGIDILEWLLTSRHKRHMDTALDTVNYGNLYESGQLEKTIKKVETLQLLQGIVDMYMPDLKYGTREAGAKYPSAPDYFEILKKARLLAGIKE